MSGLVSGVLCLGLCFFYSLEFVSGLVSGWKPRLALGSCSAHARGFGILPCLCVSLYFLEVLCLGLCLKFYVWAYVSFYSLGFVSGLVSG